MSRFFLRGCMFIGRERELAELERLYQRAGFVMAVIYGRRRVGKTALINKFCQGKRHVFYIAIEQNNTGALRSFSESILEIFPEAGNYLDVFSSWEKALEYVAAQAKDERIILAIDEYPYIASGDQSVSSVLQKVIDTKMLPSQLFLILCGSSMSFMEHQVLGDESPLYGRRTAQFKIEPFDYFDSAKFFPDYTLEEKILAFSVVGGVPQYLQNIARECSFWDSLGKNIFRPDGHLFEEPESLLKQELREPALYNSIITAIATGSTRLNEISTKIGEDSKKCAKYIATLVALHVVEKKRPLLNKENRNSIYALSDNLFRFWFKFVPGNIKNIESDMGSYVVEHKVKPCMAEYVGKIFETICIQYLSRRNRVLTLPFVYDDIGNWWGINPELMCQEEIDIIAISGENALFCECKWRNEKASEKILIGLMRKSELFKNVENRRYIIFSKAGFTKSLLDIAKNDDRLELITIKDLFAF